MAKSRVLFQPGEDHHSKKTGLFFTLWCQNSTLRLIQSNSRDISSLLMATEVAPQGKEVPKSVVIFLPICNMNHVFPVVVRIYAMHMMFDLLFLCKWRITSTSVFPFSPHIYTQTEFISFCFDEPGTFV